MARDEVGGGAVEGGWRVRLADIVFTLVAEGFSFKSIDFLTWSDFVQR